MPPAYQRRRTQEIKERETRRQQQEPLVVPETVAIATETEYEVVVPCEGYVRWYREAKFREQWPVLCKQLNCMLSELESYVLRHRRVRVLPPKNIPPLRSIRYYME